MVVVMPLRIDGKLCAEVRMRGNLDLNVDSFALGFDRRPEEDWGGLHVARLIDLGDVGKVKDDAKKEKKDRKATEKNAERTAEAQRRTKLALDYLDKHGTVSGHGLALEHGLSANTWGPILKALANQHPPLIRYEGKRGYVRAEGDDDRQGALL
jgi:hypothetical protein